MFLDTLKLRSSVLQIQFPEAFELWDTAGAIARRLATIWPGLGVVTGEPFRIVLQAPGINIRQELKTAIISVAGVGTLDGNTARQLRETVECWTDLLQLKELSRVSMLVEYAKQFPNLAGANAALAALQLVKWPAEKVFDQPVDGTKNGVEVIYRFEDDNTFSVLRLRTEGLVLERHNDPDYFDEPITKVEKNRLLVSFDRGTLKPMDAKGFRADEWLKGYFHVLRRDVRKILG